MKLAIISDIHANLLALETSLIEIENENVDQIICLGDVAGTGAQPNETVTRLKELQIPIVMGNVDAFILNKSSRKTNSENFWIKNCSSNSYFINIIN